MKKGFILKRINIERGNRVEYDYEYDSSLKQYFCRKKVFFAEYDVDISHVPVSLLSIPLLANVLPISWFIGFDVYVDALDAEFFKSQAEIKEEFQSLYPALKENFSSLYVRKIIKNSLNGSKSAMFFSAGIDSYTTFFRHQTEAPDLVTLIGADIPISDKKQTKIAVELISSESLLTNNCKYIVRTNLRDFYTYKVDLLLPRFNWWGEVQHGMSIIGSIVPLSYIRRYSKVYIASSRTNKVEVPWGSAPHIDNKMRWSDLKVIHDGEEMEREEKVDYFVQKCNEIDYRPKLRVCHSELNRGVNCSKCEKCIRTCFSIMLSGDNPNLYGFHVNENIFDEVMDILAHKYDQEGHNHYWMQLVKKFRSDRNKAFLFNLEIDDSRIDRILNTCTKENSQIIERRKSRLEKTKFIIRNKLSGMFKLYLKIRQRKI